MTTAKLKMPNVPALDGFRALAVLIVIISHAGAGKFIPGGFGVTIFFFLSGYLITSLLRIEAANFGRIDLQDFYVRRSIRIGPPLFVTGVIVAALSLMGLFATRINLPSVVVDAAFLTNYNQSLPESWRHSLPMPLWSLDVEEHFYIIFSTVFAFLLIRTKPSMAARYCALACGIVLSIRCANALFFRDIALNYYWSHTRMDSILFGCILALWNNPAVDKGAWRPSKLSVAGAFVILALCFVVRGEIFRETIRYTLQGGALFVIFSASLHDRDWALGFLGSAPLRWIALISYTLYLIHFPVFQLVDRWQVPGGVITGVVISVLYATGMYWVIERPLGNWRRARKARFKPGLSR